VLAVAAFLAFVIAAILHLIGQKSGVVEWCIIIGGLLVAAHCCAYGRPWYRFGGRT
jgi:hypothetical protein